MYDINRMTRVERQLLKRYEYWKHFTSREIYTAMKIDPVAFWQPNRKWGTTLRHVAFINRRWEACMEARRRLAWIETPNDKKTLDGLAASNALYQITREYLRKHDIPVDNPGEVKMTNLVAIRVSFDTSITHYLFYAPPEMELKVGDYCIVKTSTSSRPQIARVEHIDGMVGYPKTRTVMARVDLSEYREYMREAKEKERAKNETRQRIKQLKREQKEREEVVRMELFQERLRNDPVYSQIEYEINQLQATLEE